MSDTSGCREAVRPFPVEVAEAELVDLRRRLLHTRWPEAETVHGWVQGVPLAYMQALVAYWANQYDWRPCEAHLNSLGTFVVEIDGLEIHFLHARSQHEPARPILLTHGWPGSIIEFLDLIPHLTEPLAHGGDAEDAFHVIAPSLPGHGFSGKPRVSGWGVDRIADAWASLMEKLGYRRYLAQGGDWGSLVSERLLGRHPERCAAIHLNLVFASPTQEVIQAPTPEELQALTRLEAYRSNGAGYAAQQRSKPQTLGYGLTDSPAGQAAWIVEKFHDWTDSKKRPEGAVSLDRLLDNISLYWLTSSAASSARLYWESAGEFGTGTVDQPVGCTIFPGELTRPSRRWAESRYKRLIYWATSPAGGHFPAMEQPAILAEEIRRWSRKATI